MKYPLLTASFGVLTIMVGWLPLGLGLFGSYIAIGAMMCFVPTSIMAVFVGTILYLFQKKLHSFGALRNFLAILTGLTITCVAPLVLSSVPISRTDLVQPGYWIVATILLACGSLATTTLARKNESEQGGDGDAEEAV